MSYRSILLFFVILDNKSYLYYLKIELIYKNIIEKSFIINCLKDIPDTITTSLEKYKFYVKVNKEKGKITANKQYFEQILNTIEI